NGIDAIHIDLVASSLPILAGTNGSATVNVTLLDNFPHPDAGGQNVINLTGINVVATDSDGDQASATVQVNVTDDVPTAVADSATQTTENAPVTVNVFANDVPGADGVNITDPTKVSYVAGSLAGGTGTVTYHNDGTFTYAPVAGEEGTVTFQYQIVDGDGDPSVTTVTINLLKDSTPTLVIAAGSDTSVNEAGLPVRGIEPAGSGEIADHDGTNNSDPSETATGALTITTGSDTIGHLYVTDKNNLQVEVTNGGLVHGQYGDLTITGTPATGYTYSYTLLDNTSGNTTHDDFAVQVVDSDGDPASTTLSIAIVDDVPTAVADSATQTTENAPVTVNVFANDVPGADGVNITDPTKVSYVAGSLAGGTGTVTYHNDGTFTYAPVAGEEGTVTFQYQIVDGDGDPSVTTVTINLLKDSTPTLVIAAGSDTSVNEAGLPVRGIEPAGSGEIADHDGTNNSDPSETATGALTITTGSDTIGHLYVTDKNNLQVEVTNGGLVHGQYGDLTITGTPATGYTYSYTLLDNTSGNTTHDDFAVQVVDSDGDPASTTLSIAI
ncbi:Ig-like domain-containing protein, partial [Mesorhizobium sp. M8A.F.Ca.ET.181.01.1.1]